MYQKTKKRQVAFGTMLSRADATLQPAYRFLFPSFLLSYTVETLTKKGAVFRPRLFLKNDCRGRSWVLLPTRYLLQDDHLAQGRHIVSFQLVEINSAGDLFAKGVAPIPIRRTLVIGVIPGRLLIYRVSRVYFCFKAPQVVATLPLGSTAAILIMLASP